MAKDKKSPYTNKWITEMGIPIVQSYGGNITLRALHYQLVARGMTNDICHYKKVVAAMTAARWEGKLDFNSFLDHERGTLGRTNYEATEVEETVGQAKSQIRSWATSYSKNRWENQPVYPEVFIEKKALQGVFDSPCSRLEVALSPCKGYPSLTFQYACKRRFDRAIASGKKPIILYFGDYDCSGEDIPRSIAETLSRMGTDIEVKRIALMEDQVVEWDLPPAPTKVSDSRSRNWNGLGQVELDAVEPKKIEQLCTEAIEEYFDPVLYDELMELEKEEKQKFKKILKRDFKTLLD